jgi:hypothetical protein
MAKSAKRLVLQTREDYRNALDRANALRSAGANAETNAELATIEGAIARYVAKPGKPALRKGRPSEGGSDVM